MYIRLFNEFLTSSDTLRVYQGNKLFFSSNKDRLIPLLDYIDRYRHNPEPVAIPEEFYELIEETINCKVGGGS